MEQASVSAEQCVLYSNRMTTHCNVIVLKPGITFSQ